MRHVLVVGVELLSRVIDWEDRGTCVLFGDGAGAAVIGPADPTPVERPRGILSTKILSDGSFARALMIPGGGSISPASHEMIDQKLHKVKMKGQDIFKAAVKNLYSASKEAVDESGMRPEDVDWICPHQANLRIINQAVERLGVNKERVLINIDKVCNTSSASIPILLDQNIRAGKIKEGETVLMCALGAGISWGSALVRL
jgi:3-oxoacyl-[acyl-carrier-protein] synthase-3